MRFKRELETSSKEVVRGMGWLEALKHAKNVINRSALGLCIRIMHQQELLFYETGSLKTFHSKMTLADFPKKPPKLKSEGNNGSN